MEVNGNQNWLLIFFKNIIFCVLQRKVIQVWTQIRVRKSRLNSHFWVVYPLKV